MGLRLLGELRLLGRLGSAAARSYAAAVDLAGLIECVPNVSEGRDAGVIDALAHACGPDLLDVHTDPDHHRSVFTLAGTPESVEAAMQSLAAACVARVDLAGHDGVHPRLGALDVVPFVDLDPKTDERLAVDAARRFAAWLGAELEVPAFLYDAADPGGRSLPAVRRGAFSTHHPDHGPPAPHPSAGASAVGARPLLVALNCDLDTDILEVAVSIAAAVRESSGGLPGVRALGLALATAGCAQVSMNLTDLPATGIEAACTAVRERAVALSTDITRVELVGLMPAAEFARCSDEFRAWSGLDASMTIEARLAARETAL